MKTGDSYERNSRSHCRRSNHDYDLFWVCGPSWSGQANTQEENQNSTPQAFVTHAILSPDALCLMPEYDLSPWSEISQPYGDFGVDL
jgi:hypothetical protein